ncbi:MAG: hypothetical protein MR293_03245 [Bacteroidales bacterium]|nr:hypothetical protein [Bacteroidales bacterium]
MRISLPKSLLLSAILCMWGGIVLSAAEPAGSSCDNPIALTEEYDAVISEPGTYWFSSWTYDLPVKVYYIPDDNTNTQPLKAYVDFTCTPGVYDDPNLVALTDMANGWGYSMPLEFVAKSTTIDGKPGYELMVEDTYRELMRQFDITYNVEAKVQVEIPAAGKVQLAPDSVFRKCIESSHWLQLPDTIGVSPSSSDSVFVMPVTDWKNDSIRMLWTGTEQPLSIWLGSSCDFELNTSDPNVIDYLILFPNTDEHKNHGYYNYMDFSATDLQELITEFGEGGLYYVKLVSAEKAKFVIDYKAMSEEMARAIPMEWDKSVAVSANDTAQCYYFCKDWNKYSVQWTVDVSDTIVAYFGTTPTFAISSDDVHYVGKRYLYPQGDRSVLALSSRELSSLSSATDMDFVFVRFDAPADVDITPSVWNVGDCANNSTEILPNDSLTLLANRPADVYRIDYEKWRKGNMSIRWDGFSGLRTYLGDTCSFNLAASNVHVLHSASLQKIDTMEITRDWWMSVSDRVDADGFLYFRFNTSGVGYLYSKQTILPDTGSGLEVSNQSDLTLEFRNGLYVVRVENSQTLTLYNSLGQVLQSWYQLGETKHTLEFSTYGVYLLKGSSMVYKIVCQ